MSYFPAYLKLDDKKIIIIGGGKIATEKLEKLLDFTSNITIISRDISEKIRKLSFLHNFDIIKKDYKIGDIDGFDITIVAVDDIELQKNIYNEAKNKHILCNAVDSAEYCDFIFPSYIKDGDLIISVSTSGASPAVAKYLRRYIQKCIPKGLSDFLKEIKLKRKHLPKGKERMKLLDNLAKEFFKMS